MRFPRIKNFSIPDKKAFFWWCITIGLTAWLSWRSSKWLVVALGAAFGMVLIYSFASEFTGNRYKTNDRMSGGAYLVCILCVFFLSWLGGLFLTSSRSPEDETEYPPSYKLLEKRDEITMKIFAVLIIPAMLGVRAGLPELDSDQIKSKQ